MPRGATGPPPELLLALLTAVAFAVAFAAAAKANRCWSRVRAKTPTGSGTGRNNADALAAAGAFASGAGGCNVRQIAASGTCAFFGKHARSASDAGLDAGSCKGASMLSSSLTKALIMVCELPKPFLLKAAAHALPPRMLCMVSYTQGKNFSIGKSAD